MVQAQTLVGAPAHNGTAKRTGRPPNPKVRDDELVKFRDAARGFGKLALARLVDVLADPTAKNSHVLYASQMILAYAYGRPTSKLDVSVGVNDMDHDPDNPPPPPVDPSAALHETLRKAAESAAAGLGIGGTKVLPHKPVTPIQEVLPPEPKKEKASAPDIEALANVGLAAAIGTAVTDLIDN